MNRSLVFVFGLLFLVATAYRVIPYSMRPEWLGAPQLAMALFAGSVVAKRKYAFLVSLASMLLSDVAMHLLYLANPGDYIPGFYKGQVINYILIVGTTTIGFFINSRKPLQIAGGAVAGSLVYFLLSNFQVWLGGGGLHRAKTVAGLLQTYVDGLPFLTNSLAGTLLFSALFFGVNALLPQRASQLAKA